ncbi:MAG: radical SAM protein [Alphaproteobacteria bacterium]|nr:radical SAM protein [Alphaproteobacteria bacterium]MDE2493564.1 radical SAM protein [Alphaproteobacteria bacterium]
MDGQESTLARPRQGSSTDAKTSPKFKDRYWTAKGEPRAVVPVTKFLTLWFNTGTLCNLTCQGCYIESSPQNDRLAYLTREEVRTFLAEAWQRHRSIREIGFTGGEPFMNPEIVGMLEDSLSRGYRALVLTNGMLPMQHHRADLLDLRVQCQDRLSLRVSLDHYTAKGHERVRGQRTWGPAINGLKWLSDNGFDISVAARLLGPEDEPTLREGFAALFSEGRIAVDAYDPHRLVLFPEMDASTDVPEITEHCWSILGKHPSDVMCATSRMVIKRKVDGHPAVVSCTLLPYESQFEMGRTLSEAKRPVHLNHPHCTKFCVLGGSSCSQ